MKVTVAKQMAGGEQVVVELSDSEVHDGSLDLAYKIVDGRLHEMNQRVLALNDYYKEIVKKYPKAAMMVNDIILVLVGQKVFEDKSVERAVKLAEKHGDEVPNA